MTARPPDPDLLAARLEPEPGIAAEPIELDADTAALVDLGRELVAAARFAPASLRQADLRRRVLRRVGQARRRRLLRPIAALALVGVVAVTFVALSQPGCAMPSARSSTTSVATSASRTRDRPSPRSHPTRRAPASSRPPPRLRAPTHRRRRHPRRRTRRRRRGRLRARHPPRVAARSLRRRRRRRRRPPRRPHRRPAIQRHPCRFLRRRRRPAHPSRRKCRPQATASPA